MASKELISADMKPELMPDALQNDVYYVGNDRFVQQEMKVKAEILDLQQSVEPWEARLAQLYAAGTSKREIGKQLKKTGRMMANALDTLPVQTLVHHWQHLAVLRDGPNEIVRKQMLWRIAVDNEKADPKETTKALAELNRMAAPKGGAPGQTLNIIISNQVLKKGPLDG